MSKGFSKVRRISKPNLEPTEPLFWPQKNRTSNLPNLKKTKRTSEPNQARPNTSSYFIMKVSSFVWLGSYETKSFVAQPLLVFNPKATQFNRMYINNPRPYYLVLVNEWDLLLMALDLTFKTLRIYSSFLGHAMYCLGLTLLRTLLTDFKK